MRENGRTIGIVAGHGLSYRFFLILRACPQAGVSKDYRMWASWFETREDALLTMRRSRSSATAR
jgi:hypothetical protein